MAYDTSGSGTRRPSADRSLDRSLDRPLDRFLGWPYRLVLAEFRLRVRAQAPRTARRWMAEVAAEWDAAHITGDLQLCTSELVTNVHLHAPGSTLRLLAVRDGARLRVEVHDGDRTTPLPRRAALGDVTGRGLFLVAHVADCHGTYPTATGKATWFALTAWARNSYGSGELPLA